MACAIISCYDYLTDSELRLVEHKLSSGSADDGGAHLFYFSPSNASGHYHLELSRKADRHLMGLIFAVNHEEKSYRQSSGLFDTSQNSDFDNFRNERLDGEPTDIDMEMAATGGYTGSLEFDFVSTTVLHRRTAEPPMHPQLFSAFEHELGAVPSFVAGAQDTEYHRGSHASSTEGGAAEDAAAQQRRQLVETALEAMATQLHPERAGIPGRDDAATIAAICRQHKLARAKVRRRFCWWSPVQ